MYRDDGRGWINGLAFGERMKRTSLFLLMVMTVSAGWGVQHVVPGTYPHPHPDMIHQPTAAQIKAHGSFQAATIASASGGKSVAVIIVQFAAGKAALISGSRSIQSLPTIDSHFVSMAQYYDEVSYHKIGLTFKFFGPNTGAAGGDVSAVVAGAYTFDGTGGTPNHPMEYYGCGDEGQGDLPPCTSVSPSPPTTSANGNYLTRDAIVTARNGGHTGLVSKDKDPVNGFDEVIVVHAGNGNETTPCRGVAATNGDIWSIFYSADPQVIGGQSPVSAQAQLAGFSEGDVVPETESACSGITSPLGVMAHEFGHSLGLPDLYNTSAIGGSSVVGQWELMDAGPYDGSGANPSHMGAWDKMTLGWVTPIVSGTRQNVTQTAIETTQSLLKIPVLNGLPQEYFLVEYRRRASGATYDRSIPGDGLLVWHIDDAITSSRGINATQPSAQNTVNTGSPHYGVSIIPADGVTVGSNQGDPGNPFIDGRIFTSPNSNTFAGQPSGISLVDISGVGGPTVTSQVANLVVTPGQSITKLTNYPNPAGKGYAHPSGAGHTTIQAQLTRPANDMTLLIYTLSGDLVRKIGLTEIGLTLARSADEKWVYEYVWDLTNGDGAMVAPGVYLYLLRADGVTKSNKMVIIR